MSAAPSEEAVRQLHLRYCLTAEAAKTYFDGGFSVVVQDNYYGEALPRMLRLLQGYPVEAVVLCPSLAAVKEREEKRAKTGYTAFRRKLFTTLFWRKHSASASGWTTRACRPHRPQTRYFVAAPV